LESVKAAETRRGAHSRETWKPELRFASDVPAGGIVQTALDGSFVIPDVPPGSYYVVAAAAGYLSPRANAENIDEAEPPAPAGQPPVVIPKVDVQADQTAAVDIRLERGAAVSGTIRFDDGSPAAGIHVGLEHKSKDKVSPLTSTDFGIRGAQITDDLGRYRISGLRGGDYILETVLFHLDLIPRASHGAELTGLVRSSLMIYSGDATRKSDAVSFKLGAGEERAGEDINIPLSKLHSVSGVVTAARDGHAINGGNLQITIPEDNETIVDAEIGNDGGFHLESVPEGTYILRAHNARDKQVQTLTAGSMTLNSEKTLHQYGDLEQSIKIEGDIPNLVLAVPEPKNSTATAVQ
jgi:hypothetical protein